MAAGDVFPRNLKINADNTFDGSTNKAYTAANKTTVSGIELPRVVNFWHYNATVISGDAITITVASDWAYYFYASQGAGLNGNSFSHDFLCAAGTYKFLALGNKTSSLGIIDWYIDDVEVVSSQDWYKSIPEVGGYLQTQTGIAITAGYHTLKGTVDGKNGSSSGYGIRLQRYSLVRTGA